MLSQYPIKMQKIHDSSYSTIFGIPILWSKCKQNSIAEIVKGEDQLFLDTCFFSLFFEEILKEFVPLYVPLFYGGQCNFYKLDKKVCLYSKRFVINKKLRMININLFLLEVDVFNLILY